MKKSILLMLLLSLAVSVPVLAQQSSSSMRPYTQAAADYQEDINKNQQEQSKRLACEEKSTVKGQDVCALCKTSINPACGPVNALRSTEGKVTGHAHHDCLVKQRLEAKNETFKKEHGFGLDEVLAFSKRQSQEAEERAVLHEQLIKELKEFSDNKTPGVAAGTTTLVVHPITSAKSAKELQAQYNDGKKKLDRLSGQVVNVKNQIPAKLTRQLSDEEKASLQGSDLTSYNTYSQLLKMQASMKADLDKTKHDLFIAKELEKQSARTKRAQKKLSQKVAQEQVK